MFEKQLQGGWHVGALHDCGLFGRGWWATRCRLGHALKPQMGRRVSGVVCGVGFVSTVSSSPLPSRPAGGLLPPAYYQKAEARLVLWPAPWKGTPSPRGKDLAPKWALKGTSRQEGGWLYCGDKGLVHPPVPGEGVLSSGPGALAWVSGLAAYGYHPPNPMPAERNRVWAGVAAIQVDAGPLSSWEWGQEEGLCWLPGGLWQDWELGFRVQNGGMEPGGGGAGRQVGLSLCGSPTLHWPAQCAAPLCPGHLSGSTPWAEVPVYGGLPVPTLPRPPQPPLSSLPLRQLAHGQAGAAGLGALFSLLSSPYQGVAGGGHTQVVVGGLQGQLRQLLLLLLPPWFQVETLEEKEVSAAMPCARQPARPRV